MIAILAASIDLPGMTLARRSSLDVHIVAWLCVPLALALAAYLWRYHGGRQ